MTTNHRALRIMPAVTMASAALVLSGATGAHAGIPITGPVPSVLHTHVVTAHDIRVRHLDHVSVSASLVAQLQGAVVKTGPQGDVGTTTYAVVVTQAMGAHGNVSTSCPAAMHVVKSGAVLNASTAGVHVRVADNGTTATAVAKHSVLSDTIQVGVVCSR